MQIFPLRLPPRSFGIFPGDPKENPVRARGSVREEGHPVSRKDRIIDINHPTITKNGFNYVNGQPKLCCDVICGTSPLRDAFFQVVGHPLRIHTVPQKTKDMDFHLF